MYASILFQSEKPRKPRKKKKKDEDPNKPKRAPSAYMMWLNENREDIKKQVPDGGVADVAKKAGEIWNKLETDEKARWQDKASEAKREYQKAMIEYNKQKEEEGGNDDEEEEEQG